MPQMRPSVREKEDVGEPVLAYDNTTAEQIWSTILTFTITYFPALVLFLLLALDLFENTRHPLTHK